MMKNLLLFVFTFLFSTFSIAQGNNCANSEPFCTGSTYNFPAGVNNGSAESGNNYGCLFTQPNPAWYYMEIDQPGDMTIMITNSNNVDIDFILYGPYTSYTQAMSYCGNMGAAGNGAPLNGIEDCSYSGAATEYADITNAQSGEVYVLLITNYSNQNTNISFTNTGGTATTDCSIVEPCTITSLNVNVGACNPATGLFNVTGTVSIVDPPATGSLIAVDCNGNQTTVANAPFGASSYNFAINNITANGAACGVNVYFTADPACAASVNYNNPPPCAPNCFFSYLETNISACNPSNNTFSITGVVEFQDAPASGTMTVSDCNGNSQVFNAPFSSPTNYSLTGIDSDGTTNCNINVVFSADPACTMSSGLFNYPSNCVCDADAGTYSDAVIGNTNTTGLDVNLCFGDQLNITANGDYIPSEDFNVGGATYNPGQWLLVYDCPPTVVPPGDLTTDPCLLGVASTNDQAWGILNTSGSGQTLYYVPVTMYSMVDGVYAISLNGGNWCYDIGPTYEVTYLPQITTNQVQNCQTGTLAVTVNGGQPAVDGSSFTASNLLPANASFDNTTTTNGGTINVSGLVDGDNYSFNITDINGCPVTVSGTFSGTQDASFTYPSNQYCQNLPNPSPTVTGVTGGTFSSTAGLSINSSTGVINLGASTPGTYTVSYQSPHAVCFSIETFIITVDPLPNVTVNDPSICVGQTVTLTAGGANTYTWSPGTYLTATTGTSVDATPPSTISYTVTGTDANGCVNTDQVNVTVNPLPTATISGTIDLCINSTSPNITFTGVSGTAPYTFTYNINGGANQNVISTGNTATVSVPTGVAGTFTYNLVSVQDGSATACSQAQSGSVVVTIHNLPNVFAGNDLTVCEGQTTVLTGSGASSYIWDNGISNGVPFIPTVTTIYTVTGTSVAGCENTDNVTITVIPTPQVSFTGVDLVGCSPVTPTFTNTSTGNLSNCTWTFNNGQNLSGCGNVTATFTNPGCYDVTLTVTTPEGCSNSATIQNYVCVEPNPIANFSANPNAMTTVDPTTQLTNLSTGASSYNWTFGDGSAASNEISPSHTYLDAPGVYIITLTAYSPAGCTDIISQVVTITEELIFYVPNAFTPDNDQYNEVFKPIFSSGFDPFNYNLLIFNRWGEVLFESNDTNFGWDGTYGGKIVQDGVYIWKITVKRSDVDDREQYVGHVTLIR